MTGERMGLKTENPCGGGVHGEQTIPFCISWLGRLLRTRFDSRARALGLTRSQWSMIATASMMEGATQSELASALEINSVTAGRIIDKLEASGWIERRANPADRRANRLYLGESAAPMMDRLNDIAVDEERIALKDFTAEEEQQLLSLLQRMLGNLNTTPMPPSPPMADDELLPSGCA